METKHVSVWVAEPVITKEQVEKITEKASLLTNFRLLFVKSRYSFDDGSVIRYKQMGGITYVMKRGTHIEPEPPHNKIKEEK